MATANSVVKDLLKTIDRSLESFEKSIPKIERQIFSEIQLQLKTLDLDRAGNIKQTIANLTSINIIRSKIQRIMQGKAYRNSVSVLSNSLKEVRKINDDYFRVIESPVNRTKFIRNMEKQAIADTRLSLGIASGKTKNPAFTQTIVSRAMDIVEQNTVFIGHYKTPYLLCEVGK